MSSPTLIWASYFQNISVFHSFENSLTYYLYVLDFDEIANDGDFDRFLPGVTECTVKHRSSFISHHHRQTIVYSNFSYVPKKSTPFLFFIFIE